MIGIRSVGGHVPRYRLSGKALGAVWGGGGAGERAVADYDEDSLTMSCEAALNALHGRDIKGIGACFLASTSAPYAEKSSAAILATVADLSPEVLTADLGGSLRCGTTALRLALDTVKAGSAAQALVAAGDVRPVAPGTPEEAQLGDGAGAALEESKPGDQVLVVSYGSGAEALLFQCTEALAKVVIHRPVSAQLAGGVPLPHYGKFLNFRRHVETEVIRAFASVPTAVREEKQDLRLYGQKCADCGAVSYPRRHLCWQCSSKKLADYKISRRGKVFTFTKDHLVPNPDPPTVMVSADLEGGGRFYGQLTDCDPATVGFEMPVELCFRRFHEGEGFISYFWKFRPA